jgi:hypothetical protein
MTTVTTPGPYEAKVPRNDPPRGGYRTAEQELAEALEGTAPHLTRTVAGLIGPQRTAELAKAVARATDLAVRRHAFEHLAQALVLVEQGLGGIPAECETPESMAPWEPHEPAPEPPPPPAPPRPRCDHSESLHGRCVACGMTWEQQAEVRRG